MESIYQFEKKYLLIKALQIAKSQETIVLILPEEAKCSFPLNGKRVYQYSISNY